MEVKSFSITDPTIYDKKYYSIKFDDEINFYVKLQDTDICHQFKMCVDEYEHLKDVISSLHPKKIVDLGCGMGRSSVFFYHMFSLKDTKFFMGDFDKNTWRPQGENKGALGYHDNNNPIPFNSLDLTNRYCDYNNLKNREVMDLDSDRIKELKDIDLLYSFYSVGYHWSIDKAIERYGLLDITTSTATFIFGVRKENKGKPFSGLNTKESSYLKLEKVIGGNVFQDFGVYTKK